MRTTLTAAMLFGAVAAMPVAGMAQNAQSQGSENPAVRTDDRTAGTPVPGANSFTEGQARSRIEDAGFSNVTDLQKDDQGIWRGKAMRAGAPADVAFDFQGNVFAGGRAVSGAGAVQGSGTATSPGNPPGTAAGRAVDRTLGTDATGANPGAARPDGSGGNPPSTAVGRAVDRAQGQAPQPDGSPGNAPGTAAGRGTDRALGTNSTGTNPGAGSAPAR